MKIAVSRRSNRLANFLANGCRLTKIRERKKTCLHLKNAFSFKINEAAYIHRMKHVFIC